ncbi:intracellular adhesion protein IcaD [Staphylococcus intermedius]|uniref:Poly-beta-1,6-N-acetyl-D-glucosamine synthesis protein IcaD n=1 Tax=Staphylococcus intermedius NCTC 11048 TaxID=1141106 RepID=A0A380G501_STAIN|nr:intracellular adhesion protein IcaD [Staphylococcus intermedius]PCF64112.1 intracellular adhesion protein D [Staphylococcus intermedius]PCF78827.1 intracellular adhesion protein D [Staphylococcus intermedius]PCF79800.1 intracellular adhesion protein D [Staphylococcus intermedius]PCF85020.1 intracellular adhesion protein D [Staphylococcus intermedius]PCF89542.1 intracellular adhesion protein D [Staphylococcus intermedius]
MVKSRQRHKRKQLIHTLLNFIRETIILIFSLSLWFYCIIAFILIVGSLLHSTANSVLLIRSVLNIEMDSMNQMFFKMAIFIGVVTLIFITSILIHQYKNKKEGINDGKFL